ncbi:DUF1697 domain-containing protein [uncultured Pelagibacterium sp.]|uniref:DUF1697 domain-containing protein n=1 Tax=uncultured Pelagibacterium sp. TaxID=1159875 RepID=UPI0030D918F2
MTRFVGLLYSISLPDGKRVINAPWRELLEALGHSDVRTLLATGNVVFTAEGNDPQAIEKTVEPAFAKAFGRHIDFIVREGTRWERLVAANPFPEQSKTDGSRVAVRVMREPMAAEAQSLIEDRASGAEIVRVIDGDPWIYFGDGFATSKLAGVLTAGRTGIGTSRNWNTVKKIADAL